MEDLQLLQQNNIEPIKTLGQGAYGRVYLAFHNDLGVIAAKVLRIEKFDEKEWDAAGALNKPEFQCPFVVKYLFAKQFENDVVILMSYANAKSLDVIVKNQYQFLSIPTFRALAKQLLEGLRIIHSAKLIHRDIKSENIMLHAQQGNVKAKIADFGLAKINQENQLKITSCGTPLNMAPELVNHSFYSDNKVDIWSLGVVFFQLLTHEYPIQAGGFPELQNKMAWMKRINRHAAIKDDILWDLLSKMLNFDPKQRYSAEQALQHPFFTSQQASSEISQYALQIAQSATNAQQKGETWITIYDTNATFIVPSPEIKVFLNFDPEAEELKILSTRKPQIIYQNNPQQNNPQQIYAQQQLQQYKPNQQINQYQYQPQQTNQIPQQLQQQNIQQNVYKIPIHPDVQLEQQQQQIQQQQQLVLQQQQQQQIQQQQLLFQQQQQQQLQLQQQQQLNLGLIQPQQIQNPYSYYQQPQPNPPKLQNNIQNHFPNNANNQQIQTLQNNYIQNNQAQNNYAQNNYAQNNYVQNRISPPHTNIEIYRSPSPSTMSSTNIKLPSPDVKLPPVPVNKKDNIEHTNNQIQQINVEQNISNKVNNTSSKRVVKDKEISIIGNLALAKQNIENDRIEKERKEKERIEQERKDNERIIQEMIEKEKLEKYRLEQERIAEQQRIEQQRIEQERIAEQQRIEQERIAEQQRIEQEKIAEQQENYQNNNNLLSSQLIIKQDFQTGDKSIIELKDKQNLDELGFDSQQPQSQRENSSSRSINQNITILEGQIKCPFCYEIIFMKQLNNHILQEHLDKNQKLIEMYIIQVQLENIKEVEEQQQQDNQEDQRVVNCPYCKDHDVINIQLIINHVSSRHNNEYNEFLNINQNNEQIKQILNLDVNQQQVRNIPNRRKIQNKEGMHQRNQKQNKNKNKNKSIEYNEGKSKNEQQNLIDNEDPSFDQSYSERKIGCFSFFRCLFSSSSSSQSQSSNSSSSSQSQSSNSSSSSQSNNNISSSSSQSNNNMSQSSKKSLRKIKREKEKEYENAQFELNKEILQLEKELQNHITKVLGFNYENFFDYSLLIFKANIQNRHTSDNNTLNEQPADDVMHYQCPCCDHWDIISRLELHITEQHQNAIDDYRKIMKLHQMNQQKLDALHKHQQPTLHDQLSSSSSSSKKFKYSSIKPIIGPWSSPVQPSQEYPYFSQSSQFKK